jgi:hypothetical protein
MKQRNHPDSSKDLATTPSFKSPNVVIEPQETTQPSLTENEYKLGTKQNPIVISSESSSNEESLADFDRAMAQNSDNLEGSSSEYVSRDSSESFAPRTIRPKRHVARKKEIKPCPVKVI